MSGNKMEHSSSQPGIREFFRRPRPSSPILIAVEGLDGSGKTVQANRLCAYLQDAGKRVRAIDFPQYSSFFGGEIGKLLSGTQGTSALELDGKSMCLWYAMDRWKALQTAELEQYDYVIFNRYTLSNVVYQSARQYHGLDLEFARWVFELEHIQLGLPVPDLYLYLDTQARLSEENVLKKAQRDYVEGLDVYESSQNLLLHCRRIYRELAEAVPELQTLECMDPAGRLRDMDEISRELVGRLSACGLAP